MARSLYRHRSRRDAARVGPHWRTVTAGPLAGLEFFMPDWGGWSDRIVAGTYEIEMLKILQEAAVRGGVFYDVGAHVGFFTCAWLKLGGDAAHAFEPLRSNFEVAEKTVARNGMAARAALHNIALGDFTGDATLIASENDLGTSSMGFVKELGPVGPPARGDVDRSWPRHTTAVSTLDDFVQSRGTPPASLIKIDVEGSEFEVLSGGSLTIGRYRPAILCELHGIASGAKTADHLASMGYELRFLGTTGIVPFGFWVPQTASGASQ